MLQIHARILEREKEREQMTWQQQLHHFSKSNKSASQSPDHNPDLLTPAMKEVIQMRQDRVSIGESIFCFKSWPLDGSQLLYLFT